MGLERSDEAACGRASTTLSMLGRKGKPPSRYMFQASLRPGGLRINWLYLWGEKGGWPPSRLCRVIPLRFCRRHHFWSRGGTERSALRLSWSPLDGTVKGKVYKRLSARGLPAYQAAVWQLVSAKFCRQGDGICLTGNPDYAYLGCLYSERLKTLRWPPVWTVYRSQG